MENINNEMRITDEARGYLLSTSKWTKFLAITMFVCIGIVIFSVLLLTILGNAIPSTPQTAMFGPAYWLFISIFYLIYLFPTYYMYQFAVKIQRALASDDTMTMTEAFKFQKMSAKFVGIMLIILFGLCLLAIPAAIAVGVAAAM